MEVKRFRRTILGSEDGALLQPSELELIVQTAGALEILPLVSGLGPVAHQEEALLARHPLRGGESSQKEEYCCDGTGDGGAKHHILLVGKRL